MENQHKLITGYRNLSQVEIDLMNDIKALGPQIQSVINRIGDHLEKQRNDAYALPEQESVDEVTRICAAEPMRWAQIGTTDLQKGLMAITRAVAQPTSF